MSWNTSTTTLARCERCISSCDGADVLLYGCQRFPHSGHPFDDRVGHFRRYTLSSVQDALSAAGFTSYPVCRYQDSVGSALALAFKVVGSKNGEIGASQVRLFDRWLFPISKVVDMVCRRWFGKNVFVVAVKG